MALAMEQIALVLGVLSTAVALLHLIHRLWNVNGGQKMSNSEDNAIARVVPGSNGWPLIGETWSYYRSMASNNPTKFVEERERRYNSEIFRTHLFGDELIFSADPQFNKFAMQNDERLFQSKFPKFLLNLVGDYAFFAVHGELHRKLHALTVNMLKPERIRADFMDEMQSLFRSTLDRWADLKAIVLQDEAPQMVLNLIAKQLLDLSPSKETDEIRKLFVDFVHAFVAIPNKIPGSTHAKGIKARKILISKISKIIEERKKHPEVVHHDMLSRFLEEESISQSNEIICDCILNLLFAGHETSSKAMLFAIKFLSDSPKALEQLREEHDAILKTKGNTEKLNWDDYKSMKFTQCVINETLRLGNFASGLYKEAKEDIKVKDYHIPKGSLIFLSTMSPHRDEKFYSEALKFDPWRWQLDQDISSDPSFAPFGGGPRLCPGHHLARAELSIFLHIFVTKFRWEMLANDDALYFPLPQLAKGFPIRLHLRE